MATQPQRRLTPRDLDILVALDRTPLTAGQLVKLSRTFGQPFSSERMARERLHAIGNAGWVCAARYATTSQGAGQNYYRLTRTGYRILYGETAKPPTKRSFSPLSLGRQHHTRSLAEFLVHTLVAAHAAGVTLSDFYRENTLRLQIGDECLYPDCSFRLELPTGQAFNYLVEIDNHSERIRSMQDADSWQRKLRLYDSLQAHNGERFRVLIITTRSGPRLTHILTLASALMQNPYRSLFYGAHLPAYLAENAPLHRVCFEDHRRRRAALLPAAVDHELSETRMSGMLASAPVAC